MLKNFITIAWRNIRKHKAYAAINILGLSLGVACSILIFVLVHYHLSFDTFHANKDRIYRIVTEFHDEVADYSQGTPTPLGKAFRKDYDYAEKTARVINYGDALVTFQNAGVTKKFLEQPGISYAEPDYFDIFNFPLVEGDKATVLHAPGEALITEKLAKKYFGDANTAMGKTIRINNGADFHITGILRDIPVNTDRREEIYLSYDNLKDRSAKLAGDSSWGSVYSQAMCFTRLRPTVTAAQVNRGLAVVGKKYQKGRDAQTTIFRLQPLADIHFNPTFDGTADKKYLWALSFIGLFILITACVNFINLATAQALNRSTEVGIRKVLGGLRSQLFWQFIAETALIALFAVVIGYALAGAILPALNDLFKTTIDLTFLTDPAAIGFCVALLLVVIFLSGSYPGLVLSRFQPVQALKSRLLQHQVGGFSLRRILVVTQFAISQMLIIGVIVVAGQLHYVQTTDLGFNKEAIVLLPVPVNDAVKINTLRTRIRETAGVDKLSFCANPPATESNSSTNIHFDNRKEDEHWEVSKKPADIDYLSTFGLHLVAGRNFFPADSNREYLVNETMVRRLNLSSPSEAVGKQMSIQGKPGPIVGVVRDFNNFSLHSDILPICIFPSARDYATCAVKLDPAHIHTDLIAMEKIWNETFPDYLYSYTFLDDKIAKFYESDISLLRMIEGFAAIAVFIGCLGLYGLTSFMAVRKTKEIGVRKVLGAGIPGILWLFGREFTRLVIIAFVIAAPAAWWVMHNYLQDFKYRIPIGPGIFLLSIAATATIVVFTVSYQSIRTALANPVRALRSE
ncbi:ABC transporter permease [Puia dinghuensis]|uniref:ABC transporter permease n=1 Tax=Puia dinghuensis TaxID=1792502 RepID=A0A8J2XSQ7_9BACT|nr:ABC transporter permease [Puia dinghuensis]GGA96929.1 ABC transporter permease [Puia dinghuensis]